MTARRGGIRLAVSGSGDLARFLRFCCSLAALFLETVPALLVLPARTATVPATDSPGILGSTKDQHAMRTTKTTASVKILASVALVAAAAGVAGLGTFGSFTSTTSATQAVGSGTVEVRLGAAGPANRLTVAATGLVPGDTVQRAVTLRNTGSQDLASLSLTASATTSSKLDTDAVKGLQLAIDSCSAPWTEAGASPAYSYTCTGTTKTVLATRPVAGANVALSNLGALGSGASDNLRVRITLPDTADNSFQGLDSVLGLDFTGTQRAATSR